MQMYVLSKVVYGRLEVYAYDRVGEDKAAAGGKRVCVCVYVCMYESIYTHIYKYIYAQIYLHILVYVRMIGWGTTQV